MSNSKTQELKKQTRKLTPDEIQFIKFFGVLIQTYNVPKIAEMFGTSRQAIHYHINKALEEVK